MGRGRGILLLVAGLLLLAVPLSSAHGEATPDHVHFTAAGDYAKNSNTTAGLDALATAAPDVHLALGDFSYGRTGQEQIWCDYVTSHVGATFPFELIAGNHESDGRNGNIGAFAACRPNQVPGLSGTYAREYYLDVPLENPLVRFVMISPSLTFPEGTWNYRVGDPHYEWTADVIDGARAAGIPWVVVGMHKPCLSVGDKSCEPGPDITNLLIAKKVDAVMVGHEHGYMRTKQLTLGPGCPNLTIGSYNSSCVSDEDNDMVSGAGTPWVTAGTGGQVYRDINLSDPEMPYFAATSGANQNPTYGFSDVDVTPTQMKVGFTRASGGTFTDSFTITKPLVPILNVPPVAAFTSTPDGSSASFDASTSSDLDGVITSYAWDYGDGATGTGPLASHRYAAGGTYDVTLRVMDDHGDTNSVTLPVTVSDPPVVQVLASDQFQRTLSTGWGTADLGGTWRVSAPKRTSVSGGLGRVSLKSGGNPNVYLDGVSSASSDVSLVFSLDKIPGGASGSMSQSTLVRRVSSSTYYRAIVRVTNTGAVRVAMKRRLSGTESFVAGGREVAVPGLTLAASGSLRVRAQAVGTSPTILRLKVWKAGDPEPSGWALSLSDSSSSLQRSGSVGLISFLASGTSNVPVQARYDDFQVVPAG